jgi:hypothetical protein
MNTAAMKKVTIMHELSRVPDARLDAVMTYLETLLHDIPIPSLQNQSLKGIWGNAGFEKITNLEQELHALRQELQADILKRTF